MRVKNTLFTAITAGIIFLSGIVILGKNTLMKRHAAKKDYIPVQGEQNENTKESLKKEERITELLHNKQEELALATKDETSIEATNLERNNEKVILLQKVNQLVQSRQTGKINYTINKLARKYEGKRMEKLTQAEHPMLTHQEKMGYKIREPSIVKNQRFSLEITKNDKGG